MPNNNLPPGWWIAPMGILSIIFWVSLAMAVFGEPQRVITFDNGGNVLNRAANINKRPPAVIDGHCSSACTMELKTGCITPRARLTFHPPSHPFRKLTPEEYTATVRFIAAHYPPKLAQWYLGGGHAVRTTMGYERLLEFGATDCNSPL